MSAIAFQHFSGDKVWLVLGLIQEQMFAEENETMEANMPPRCTTSGCPRGAPCSRTSPPSCAADWQRPRDRREAVRGRVDLRVHGVRLPSRSGRVAFRQCADPRGACLTILVVRPRDRARGRVRTQTERAGPALPTKKRPPCSRTCPGVGALQDALTTTNALLTDVLAELETNSQRLDEVAKELRSLNQKVAKFPSPGDPRSAGTTRERRLGPCPSVDRR